MTYKDTYAHLSKPLNETGARYKDTYAHLSKHLNETGSTYKDTYSRIYVLVPEGIVTIWNRTTAREPCRTDTKELISIGKMPHEHNNTDRSRLLLPFVTGKVGV